MATRSAYEPRAPLDELRAKVRKVRDRSTKGDAAQVQKHASDFEQPSPDGPLARFRLRFGGGMAHRFRP